MAHGAPDNYQVQKKAITYRLDDMAELAVRLGSPNVYHRLGDVILIDSFENGETCWDISTVGVQSSAKLTGVRYRTGGFSFKLTAGNIANDLVIIGRSIQPLVESKIGMEFSFAVDTVYSFLYGQMFYYNSDKIYQADVRYDNENFTLSYLNKDNIYTDLPAILKIYPSDRLFNTIKFIADFKNKEYVSVFINQNCFSLADKELYIAGNTIYNYFVFDLMLETKGNVTATAYIDDVIITQNEP